MTQTYRINIGKDRTKDGAVRRLNDEQMRLFFGWELVLPVIPACPYLLYLFFIEHDMHRCDVTGDGAGIGQTRDSRTIQPSKRHNEAMMNFLWMGGKSTSADSLMERNIDHHNPWSEEQCRLQAKNFWTIEHASQRRLDLFRQNDCQRFFRVLLMDSVKGIKQGKKGQAIPRINDLQWAPLLCRELCLPLVPGGSQSLGLPPIDSHVNRGYLR